SISSPDETFEGDKKSESRGPTDKEDKDSGKTIDEGGSVTIDRIDDPLKAVKIAMDNRVAMKEKLPEPIAEYPCAIEEAARLQFHRKLVEHNQELLAGPPPTMVYKLPPFKATLEPIEEKSEHRSVELNKNDQVQIVPDSEEEWLKDTSLAPSTKDIQESEAIPSLDEELATQLWEEVREKLKGKSEDEKPPFSAIAPSSDWDDKDDLELPPNSDWEGEVDMASEDSVLRTLPEYMGEYEAKSEVNPIPTVNFQAKEPE
ncbi:hypothetical protein, partial [Escherichia coli]|uniref:hypothetical protein n=1 Tax=Escherichia coli TaxID=562 RepID=UPI002574BE08